MTTDKIIVIIAGLALMVLVYWFFLMRTKKSVDVSGSVNIIVDGGYSPEVITVPLNIKTTLNFNRKDPNSCLEEVILGDFKIKKHLPLNENVAIEITPKNKGEFDYSCGMGMFHGKIIVK